MRAQRFRSRMPRACRLTDVAQYRIINNVGIALEFLARMSGPGTLRPVPMTCVGPLTERMCCKTLIETTREP
jgi:hypothetical protein